ncbi:MAG: hypothetical protein ACJ77X_02150 [Chloroflexota bacterium]
MSHPNLGLHPPDRTAGVPAAAARIRTDSERLAARALRVAMDGDATIQTRYSEAGLRQLLRDTGLLAERVAVALETAAPGSARDYAEWTVPLYRRRRVPMDDLIALCNGLRAALPTVLAPGELPLAGEALDEAIAVFKWHRRLAGDGRKRNPLLQLLYKGG